MGRLDNKRRCAAVRDDEHGPVLRDTVRGKGVWYMEDMQGTEPVTKRAAATDG